MMLKRILITTLAWVVIFAFVGGLCEENAPMYRVTNCREWVSLREQPSADSGRVTKVPLNALVYPGEWEGDGFRGVFYHNKVGYIDEQYLAPVAWEELKALPYAPIVFTGKVTQLAGNSAIDLDGDGAVDRLVCYPSDAYGEWVRLAVNDAEQEIKLGLWDYQYGVYVADIDSTDGVLDILVRDSGYSGDGTGGYDWSFYRYDGGVLSKIPVEQAEFDQWTIGSDKVCQFGWDIGLEPPVPDIPGDGTVRFAAKGVPAGPYSFANYRYRFDSDLEYELKDGRLTQMNADVLHDVYDVVSSRTPDALACEQEVRLYTAQSRESDVVVIPAKTLLYPRKASLSGWLYMEDEAGTGGYLMLADSLEGGSNGFRRVDELP